MKKSDIYRFMNTKGLVLILLIGFLIRLGFFLSIQPWKEDVVDNTIIVSDAIGYDELARSIVEDFSFEGEFTAYRTPGYPVFVALLYSISSNSVWFVLLVQILLNIVSVYLTYKIGSFLFSHTIGLIAAFLFAIDIHQALFTLTLLTDPLFIFLFLISIYYFCKSLRQVNFGLFCLAAFIMGLATLVRPVTFLIPTVIILFIVVFSKMEGRKKVIYSLSYCIIFVITLSPWLIRNYVKYGEAQLSSISGYNLYYWNATYVESYKTGKTLAVVTAEFDSVAVKKGVDLSDRYSFKNAGIVSEMGKEYIKENFILYWRRHFMGMVNIYIGLGTQHIASALHIKPSEHQIEPFAESNVFQSIIKFFRIKTPWEISIAIYLIIFLVINYLFALYGIFSSIKSKQIFTFLFILVILYFSFVTGIIGWVRYRLPVMPFINILCGIGLVYFFTRNRDRVQVNEIEH